MVTPAVNNYAPPKSVVADVAGDQVAEKATRGSRLGAAIIDGLIFGLPFLPSYLAAMPTIMHQAKPGAGAAFWGAVVMTGGRFYFGLLALLCTGIITAILVHKNGQTIGKKLLGIKVARKDGSRATLARIFFLRYLLNTVIGFIPLIGPLYGLIDALFIFGEPKRCCHDYIADTIVIRA
jgi:uncharacterized RDD family membrane protein YckC